MSASTLYNWKKSLAPIAEALRKGKEPVDFRVENALLRSALGYSQTETTTTRQHEDEDGALVITKTVTKRVAPNVNAGMFWLRNRRPDKWGDKPQAGGTPPGESGGIVLQAVLGQEESETGQNDNTQEKEKEACE